jgi:hypothetical protein
LALPLWRPLYELDEAGLDQYRVERDHAPSRCSLYPARIVFDLGFLSWICSLIIVIKKAKQI